MYFYRPQTKLRKGNAFTSMCQEFCPLGGGQSPPGRHPHPTPWTHIPPGQTDPPGQTPPSRRLMQRTVRILLECILVLLIGYIITLCTWYCSGTVELRSVVLKGRMDITCRIVVVRCRTLILLRYV